MQQALAIKPGFLTSEFFGTLLSTFVSVLVLFKILPLEQAGILQNQLLQFLQDCVQIVTIAGSAYMIVKPWVAYIKGRVELKAQLLAQQLELAQNQQ